MRSRLCCALLALLASCGDDPTPDAPRAAEGAPATTPRAPAASATAIDRGGVPTAVSPAAAKAAPKQVASEVAELLANAARGDAIAQGNTPAAIKALGEPALPALATALTHSDVTTRRIAAVTLLQWGAPLPAGSPATDALAIARRDDSDPAVRAAAEHAWRIATGDTTALDASRAAHEAALRKGR